MAGKSQNSKKSKNHILNISGCEICFSETYDIYVNKSTVKNNKVNSIIFLKKIFRENRQNGYFS